MNYDYRKKLFNNQLSSFPKPKEGSGLVNSIIDNLPLELHIPGYEYLGPGTNLDLKLLQNVKPKNQLDEAAKNHDIAYARSSDVDKRHEADYKLQEDAWKRVISNDADLGEKAAAYLTTNAMKVKRWLGAGIKYPINLDEKDQKMILEGIKLKKPITLDLDHEQLIRTKNSVMNETYLPLSTYQIKQIKKGIKQKKPIKLQLKVPQLEYINQNNKTGGFLPALLEALPIISAVSSIATNLVNAYNNKKANNKLVEERVKNNKTEKENLGYGIDEKVSDFINHYKNVQAAEKKLGKGFYANPMRARKEIDGEGFYITSKKKIESPYQTIVRYGIEKICKRFKYITL
jgi:hypothetical protein